MMNQLDLDHGWIEHATGGTIKRLEPMVGGGSRGMYVLDVDASDGPRELVVRVETGGGPYAATRLASLKREGSIYAALTGQHLPVPELVAISEDGRALIATRLAGTHQYPGDLEPDAAVGVHDNYLEHLARLHAIDASTLELPAPGHDNHALAWLGVWDELQQSHVRRAAPLLRLAIDWLGRNAPENPDHRSLCHGDVGPGNFLHDNGQISGLLDWELAHVGDAHDDLGMLALRGHQLNGFGDLNADLAAYEAIRGIQVDRSRVRWYRAVALVLAVTTSTMQLDSDATARVQVPLFLHLVPILELLLTQAIAELAEVELPDAGDLVATDDVEGLEGLAALRDEIAAMPASQSSMLGAGPNELVMHAEAALRLGPAVRDLEMREASRLLGLEASSHAELLRAVDGQVAGGEAKLPSLLEWTWRSGRARRLLWPAWSPVAEIPLIPIAD